MQLFHAEGGYLGDSVVPGPDGEPAEEKHLIQWVAHFVSLRGVMEILEVVLEDGCLGNGGG